MCIKYYYQLAIAFLWNVINLYNIIFHLLQKLCILMMKLLRYDWFNMYAKFYLTNLCLFFILVHSAYFIIDIVLFRFPLVALWLFFLCFKLFVGGILRSGCFFRCFSEMFLLVCQCGSFVVCLCFVIVFVLFMISL